MSVHVCARVRVCACVCVCVFSVPCSVFDAMCAVARVWTCLCAHHACCVLVQTRSMQCESSGHARFGGMFETTLGCVQVLGKKGLPVFGQYLGIHASVQSTYVHQAQTIISALFVHVRRDARIVSLVPYAGAVFIGCVKKGGACTTCRFHGASPTSVRAITPYGGKHVHDIDDFGVHYRYGDCQRPRIEAAIATPDVHGHIDRHRAIVASGIEV